MVQVCATTVHRVGLQVAPNEQCPHVPVMSWNTCAYTIQATGMKLYVFNYCASHFSNYVSPFCFVDFFSLLFPFFVMPSFFVVITFSFLFSLLFPFDVFLCSCHREHVGGGGESLIWLLTEQTSMSSI